MDAAAIGIISALIVAGVGGLVKLALRGIDQHLAGQDKALESQGKQLDKIGDRLTKVEIRGAEISGMLQRNGIDQRKGSDPRHP